MLHFLHDLARMCNGNLDIKRRLAESRRDELKSDARYFKFQKLVNAGGVPSEQVIDDQFNQRGRDYRLELAGPHPVEKYRQVKVQPGQVQKSAPSQYHT